MKCRHLPFTNCDNFITIRFEGYTYMSVYLNTHSNYLLTSKSYISLLTSLILAFGITMSSVHIHLDDLHSADTPHQVVEEDLHCVICGSVVHTIDPVNESGFSFPTPEQQLSSEIPAQPESDLGRLQDGRAPPAAA